MKRIVRWLSAVVLLGLTCKGNLLAHEIGTTLVAVHLESQAAYRIEISTDAASLIEKIDAISGDGVTTAPIPAAIDARLRQSEDLFRSRFTAAFDSVAVRPEIRYSVTPDPDPTLPPTALITLSGAIPDHAQNFSWSYSWTFATYAMTVRHGESADLATEWLEGGQRSGAVSLTAIKPPASRLHTALTYMSLGFTHIVPHGLDHMLFVLGIFLLSRRMKQVLLQVSAFTIAHSITLALSIYGVLSVSPSIVEPLIAISIAYVAIENIFMSELRAWRVALVFAFGLLHGMGFAGALQELGLPRSEFVTALVTFNVGVEAGQLAVIGAAFLLVGWYWSRREWYRQRVVLPASAAIALMAVYWTIERLSA